MKQYCKYRGYTLIELVVVIILLMILVAGSINILYLGFKSFYSQKNIINANWQASVALERMTRDLRAVMSNKDLKTAEANLLEINDINNNQVTYEVNNNTLQRNGNALADNVQQIEFHYYDNNSTKLTSLPLSETSREEVRYVTITLTMAGTDVNFSTTTAVYLWNLK